MVVFSRSWDENNGQLQTPSVLAQLYIHRQKPCEKETSYHLGPGTSSTVTFSLECFPSAPTRRTPLRGFDVSPQHFLILALALRSSQV